MSSEILNSFIKSINETQAIKVLFSKVNDLNPYRKGDLVGFNYGYGQCELCGKHPITRLYLVIFKDDPEKKVRIIGSECIKNVIMGEGKERVGSVFNKIMNKIAKYIKLFKMAIILVANMPKLFPNRDLDKFIKFLEDKKVDYRYFGDVFKALKPYMSKEKYGDRAVTPDEVKALWIYAKIKMENKIDVTLLEDAKNYLETLFDRYSLLKQELAKYFTAEEASKAL
jgi:hypothetical protein